MPEENALLAAIDAIHAAGLDAETWPDALMAATRLCGGVASTLEVFDKSNGQHLEFHAAGLPPLYELAYVDQYLALNPRVTHGLREQAGVVSWDYKYFHDEAGISNDPFYAEFLPRIGFRYFVSGLLRQTKETFAAVAVQRSPAQGHVSAAEIALMTRLVPHFRRALDVAARLKRTAAAGRSLESALDWLADGVALVRPDGSILFANEALRAIARRGDGLRIVKGALVFHGPETRARFARAIGAVVLLRAGDANSPAAMDLAVDRELGMPPYLLSVRPLPRRERGRDVDVRAVAIVFVRDPLSRNPAASAVLREVFGFTEAEANLARSLQSGTSVAQYARERVVSLNTIYTHLRRIKEKTGCKRMGELVRKLNDLQVPLRN
jgi:DNA-binding CsgD family transcriptional regulator